MRVLEPGHVYELHPVDGGTPQSVAFVRRRDENGELMPAGCRSGGLLSQELLRVLIDRTLYLYAEAPCDEDTEIIDLLRRALALYEARAARRSIEKLAKPENASPCRRCGHILCLHTTQERLTERSDHG